MAQLGWIIGVGTLLSFSCITYYTSALLADCYRCPNSLTGKRNYTYKDSVRSYLGENMHKACGFVQCIFLSGSTIGYTITASISMVAIRESNCYHKQGHEASCKYSSNWYILGVGIAEIFVSQIPNFHKLSWLSMVAALMSFTYASIGLALAFTKVISGEGGRTSLTGTEIGLDLTKTDKIWSMFRAIGDMAFACAYSPILIEIQDTLRSSPPENKVMKKANGIAVLTSTSFYLMCGCFGYAAFGNNAPGNLLTGFGFYEPFWLIDLANLCIVVHLLGAYQVLSQPVFSTVETWIRTKWPKSKFVMEEYPLSIGKRNLNFKVNLLRVCWRTGFVVVATLLAMALPFFNDILALLGALAYWPMTVFFPLEMYISQNQIKRHSVRWFWLELLNLVCFLVTIGVACSAIQGLNQGLRTYKPFKF
ncbi:amino acid transporter, putative [Ricinus communis]|uniref:Amino acid transporter, putative n=2 Tax=Ricinus communis TaxID=3988 RepID=B9RS13_RICCO|nr:amino acid transporter, putative [Ricinus communis]